MVTVTIVECSSRTGVGAKIVGAAWRAAKAKGGLRPKVERGDREETRHKLFGSRNIYIHVGSIQHFLLFLD